MFNTFLDTLQRRHDASVHAYCVAEKLGASRHGFGTDAVESLLPHTIDESVVGNAIAN